MNRENATGRTDAAALDVEAAQEWLAARTDVTGQISVQSIAGGRSNLTYLLRDEAGRRFVLRRPPQGELLPGAHDVGREHDIVERLSGSAVPVSAPIGFCPDASVAGAPFSVTGYVEGLTLRTPTDVDSMTDLGRRRLTASFGWTLAALHRVQPATIGLDPSRGGDYVARQLHVWQRQLESAAGRDLPQVHEVARRLAARAPQQRCVTVAHGDYRLDNVLVNRDGDVLAVIDWELWTLGDPLADLGAALACWIDESDSVDPLGESPTTAVGVGTRAELVESYVAATGLPIEPPDIAYYLAFGTWRFAAILEGVYRRNLLGAYGPNADGDWRRFEQVVPKMLDQAEAHLTTAG